jgi:hypothetical protein
MLRAPGVLPIGATRDSRWLEKICLIFFFFLALLNLDFQQRPQRTAKTSSAVSVGDQYNHNIAPPVLHFGDPLKPYQLKNFTGPNAYHNWASENQDICTQTLL